MMLRPVKFDTTRNPRSCKSHQSRLYHMIIINKMTLSDFIIGHLHTSTQFRQNHHFDIFVFDKNSIVFLIHLFIGHRFDDRIRINYPTTALIHPFLQENRILLRFTYFIGRDNHLFFPCFYHRIIDYKFIFYSLTKKQKTKKIGDREVLYPPSLINDVMPIYLLI